MKLIPYIGCFGSIIMSAFMAACFAYWYIPVISWVGWFTAMIIALNVGHWYHIIKHTEC